MENQWKQLERAWMFGGAGFEAIARVGQRMWARWKSLRYGTHLAALCGKGSSKDQPLLLPQVSGRKLPLHLSPWCQAIHFLPMCLWCLASSWPGYGHQRQWVWVSPCMDPWRGTAWDSRSFHLPQPQSLLFCTARSYGDFSPWHWNLGLEGRVWG